MIEVNPAHGLRLPGDRKRELSGFMAKYAALGRALAMAEDRREPWQAVDAIRLTALTGLRRGEVSGLKWSEVDLAGQCLYLRNTKTGDSVRPLGLPAVELLRSVQERGALGEFVFPSVQREAASYGGLPKAYKRIVTHKELEQEQQNALSDLTLHGLRHGFATTADGLGLTLPTVAALLGHSAGGVTARYIGRTDTVLLAAADKVAEEIARLMDGSQ
ncbi:tyrosine-type recombinase/integrase [Fodinicurvata halophila]|uniref:tyrosine-type recombinase/integrase n=1 Tax=Fodinicurvata halophila TaxID=1419723 RepID=UPI00363E820C